MNFLLVQTIIIARRGDSKGWMEILVVVVMAVIWGIGGILKAKANKDKGRTTEKPTPKPRPRLFERDTGLHKQPRPEVKPMRTKIASLRSVLHQHTVEVPHLKAAAEKDLPPAMPQVQPKREKLQDFETVPDSDRMDKQLRITEDMSQPTDSIRYSLDFEEIDDLRRAILHYEILGKPISLRE